MFIVGEQFRLKLQLEFLKENVLQSSASREVTQKPGTQSHLTGMWSLGCNFSEFHFPHLYNVFNNIYFEECSAWRIPGTGKLGGLPSMGSQSRTRLKRLSSSSSSSSRDYINTWVHIFTWTFKYAAAAAAKSLQSCPTLRPHRRQPTRLPRPWDSLGKNTGVGCHFLLQYMKVKIKWNRSVVPDS